MQSSRYTSLVTTILIALMINACGSGGSSGPTTPVGPDAFAIDYCRVVEVDGRMRVEWAANRPTTGELRYGVSVFTQLLNINMLADTHSVGLTSYQFNTTYIYRLTAIDEDGNRLDCAGEFITPDKEFPEPIISHLTVTEITESSARVEWETDEPATSILYYGIGVASDSVLSSGMNMDHSVLLEDLTPSTIYAIRPEAVDEDGLRGYGVDSSFATAARLTIWIPATQIALGDTALIPVNIENATDLAALQYALTFSSGNVEIVGVSEGAFFDDHQGFNFFRNIAAADNRLTNAMTWTIQYSGNERVGTQADGDGVVAYLELRALEPGTTGATFDADSTFGLDIFAATRSCSLRVGAITVLP